MGNYFETSKPPEAKKEVPPLLQALTDGIDDWDDASGITPYVTPDEVFAAYATKQETTTWGRDHPSYALTKAKAFA